MATSATSETKHTAGPWQFYDDENGFFEPVISANGTDIATVTQTPMALGFPYKVNGRLMAAAPELLAACSTALSLLDDMFLDGRPMPPYSEKAHALHLLNEAIAKATLPEGDTDA